MLYKLAMMVLAGVISLFMAPGRADASLMFSTDQQQYTATSGSSVAVNVYLREVPGPGDTSIIASQGGLFSAGLKLLPQNPLPTEPASLASLDDIVPNPDFSGGTIRNLDPLTLLLSDGILAEPGPAGEVLPDGSRRVLLATFNFRAGGTPGQTTSFTVTDYDGFGISSDTLTWQGTELDNAIANGVFSILVVVPEPAQGCMLMAAALALLRRWRNAHPAARAGGPKESAAPFRSSRLISSPRLCTENC